MHIRAPANLKERILRDRRRPSGKPWPGRLRAKPPRLVAFVPGAAVIVALMALSVLTARYWSTSSHSLFIPSIFQSYNQVEQHEIVPVRMASLAELKNRLTRSVDGKFSPMSYDFSATKLQLVGGMMQKIAGRTVLATVYKATDSMLACYTFLGSESDAPEVAEVFFDPKKKMNFYQFSHGRFNAVMYREGQVMCILVTQMPMENLLDLARSKAHTS